MLICIGFRLIWLITIFSFNIVELQSLDDKTISSFPVCKICRTRLADNCLHISYSTLTKDFEEVNSTNVQVTIYQPTESDSNNKLRIENANKHSNRIKLLLACTTSSALTCLAMSVTSYLNLVSDSFSSLSELIFRPPPALYIALIGPALLKIFFGDKTEKLGK